MSVAAWWSEGPILAVDPGPEKSSWALWGPVAERVLQGADQVPNADLETLLAHRDNHPGLLNVRHLVVERPVVMGSKRVANDLVETAFWAGVFTGAWPGDAERLTFKKVSIAITGDSGANEGYVKQALISRFAPSGYGKEGKGTVKAPGPFYGVTGHMWSAVAVAVAWCDLRPKRLENAPRTVPPLMAEDGNEKASQT